MDCPACKSHGTPQVTRTVAYWTVATHTHKIKAEPKPRLSATARVQNMNGAEASTRCLPARVQNMNGAETSTRCLPARVQNMNGAQNLFSLLTARVQNMNGAETSTRCLRHE